MSSWKDQQSGRYGSIYRPDNITIDIGTDWELTLAGTLDEMVDNFYWDDNDEGGDGGTLFFGIGVLTNKNDGREIMFKFWLPYYIFGSLDNPDEFYLDHEPYDQADIEVCDEQYMPIDDADVKDIVNWELEDDIIFGLYDIVDKNLYKFGYEL
jgi:hypothetical protein